MRSTEYAIPFLVMLTAGTGCGAPAGDTPAAGQPRTTESVESLLAQTFTIQVGSSARDIRARARVEL